MHNRTSSRSGASAEERAGAEQGLQVVRGALQQRLREGHRELRHNEQLLLRKSALVQSSLRLLEQHCHGSWPVQQSPEASCSIQGTVLGPSMSSAPPNAHEKAADRGSGEPLASSRLTAQLHGGKLLMRAELQDSSGQLDVRNTQLYASSTQHELRFMQLCGSAADGAACHATSTEQQSMYGHDRSSMIMLDAEALAASSKGRDLAIIAACPSWVSSSASHAQSHAHPALCVAATAADSGSASRSSAMHNAHLGSLRINWPALLKQDQQHSEQHKHGSSGSLFEHTRQNALRQPQGEQESGVGCNGAAACDGLCVEALQESIMSLPSCLQAKVGAEIHTQSGVALAHA